MQMGHVDALGEDGDALLHAAAGRGKLREAKELLQRGASVDLRCRSHRTALMTAAVMGEYAMVRLLLEHTASADLQDSVGATALMHAAYEGHQECVKELLAAGASTEVRDQDGCTALGHAEARDRAAIAKLLRQHAATPPATAAAPTPNLSGRRVRIDNLQARPWLNGRCGVAGRYDAAKGRYAVAVEGEAEAVLLKPASLQDEEGSSAATPFAVPAARTPERPTIARTSTICEPALLPGDVLVAAERGNLQLVVEWLQRSGHVDASAENGDGLLHAAASGGRLHMAKELLQRGASIDLRSPWGTTALMVAAGMSQYAMARLLLEYKASIDLQSTEGSTALMVAAYKGHTECVQELLAADASIEVRNVGGDTALGWAETKGHAAIAELLRQHAAKPSAPAAVPTPDLSGHRVRIEGLQARPELNGRCGVVGRFDAAKRRYAVAVEGEAGAVLLKPASLQDASAAPPSAEPTARASCELLPKEVMAAASSGELQQVVEWLQQSGHVDALAENGRGLLHAAAAGGHLCVAKELLQRGASVDLRSPKGLTALRMAAMGERAMVRLLLEHKASTDLQDAAGRTALMAAAYTGHMECVQELLEAGASTELSNQRGDTALDAAEKAGHAATAELLRQHAAAPPATAAAPAPHLSGRCVRIDGLQARPWLNGRCGVAGRFDAAKGRYAVAVEGEAEAVLLKPASLQDAGEASAVLPSAEPKSAPLPLDLCCAAVHGELQPVVEWLQKGEHVDTLGESGCGLLHSAVAGGSLHVAKELLQRGASVDLCGAGEDTALMLAATMGQHAMVRLLLEHKASVDLQDADRRTALMEAAYEGHQECVQELLAAGASTELRDQDGETALGLAEAKGHAAIAKLLRQHAASAPATTAAPTPNLSGRRVRIGGLQARPELNGQCGVAGRFDAAKGRYAVAVEGEAEAVLLKPINLQDLGNVLAAPAPCATPSACLTEEAPTTLDGTLSEPGEVCTAAHAKSQSVAISLPAKIGYAASSGELQPVVEWLQQGGQIDALDEQDEHGLLHVAAGEGHLRVAKELLQRGANIDLRGPKASTSLMVAAGLSQRAMVRLLLKHKASIDLQNAEGMTALTMAAAMNRKGCVQELVNARASTELRDLSGKTALEAAERKGHTAVAKLLQLQQVAAHAAAALPAMPLEQQAPVAQQVGPAYMSAASRRSCRVAYYHVLAVYHHLLTTIY